MKKWWRGCSLMEDSGTLSAMPTACIARASAYHAALLPNNGSRELLMLPVHKRGTACMRLDGPGYYYFGCPVANHAGRGMLGLIIVSGDAPATAQLDRPKQPRPKRVESIHPKRTESRHAPIDTPLCCGNVNRGVAVAHGRLFFATQNGYLVALAATNGKVVWQTGFADVRAGESATAAPLVVKNLVIAGASGGEYGVRGHRVWRRYTIPKPHSLRARRPQAARALRSQGVSVDRTNGQLVRVTKFGEQVTWGDIDASGRVTSRIKPTREGVTICPGPAGAKEWTHAAYSPRTGLLYAPTVEACATFRLVPQQYREGMFYLAGNVDVSKHVQEGRVKAIDPATGREVWSWKGEHPMVASVLATAGDLVFTGEPSGHFNAYDARTGAVLWQYQTGNGIHSNPVTYSVGGKQYIAVPTGWGGWVEGFAPEMFGAPRGTSLVVFALP